MGVEIDAELVKTSRDAAYGAGVADRATFLWQDLFVTDLRPASVVTLYLRDDVNLRLRPKLLSELAPGSRVVSHDFDMGDWRPDRVQRVRGPNRDHRLYLWLVPADVAGVWRMRLGDREALLNLTQRYQMLGARSPSTGASCRSPRGGWRAPGSRSRRARSRSTAAPASRRWRGGPASAPAPTRSAGA